MKWKINNLWVNLIPCIKVLLSLDFSSIYILLFIVITLYYIYYRNKYYQTTGKNSNSTTILLILIKLCSSTEEHSNIGLCLFKLHKIIKCRCLNTSKPILQYFSISNLSYSTGKEDVLPAVSNVYSSTVTTYTVKKQADFPKDGLNLKILTRNNLSWHLQFSGLEMRQCGDNCLLLYDTRLFKALIASFSNMKHCILK